MKKWFWSIWSGIAIILFMHQSAMSATYYVPDDYLTIQAAVDACWGGDTVIVRAGIYTGEGNKNIYINKVIDVIAESGPENTIIDSEGDGRGFRFENVNSNELRGFRIINGVADYGGGILLNCASPIIRNCIINSNTASVQGGGIACGEANPSIINCQINDNTTGGNGGGISCGTSCPSITNCEIKGNTAGGNGGGIWGNSSHFSLTNCAIIGNNADNNSGGGIYVYISSPSITNCTFAWNQASYGAGFRAQANYPYTSSRPVISNSIFYFDSGLQEIYGGNPTTVTYSNVMGGFTGDGNIDEDPQFAAGGDFHLSASSPCIDIASPDVAPGIDLDEELRPQGNGYDMGADEFDGVPAPPPCKADLNKDGDVDASDLAIFAAEYSRTDCCIQ